MRSLYFDCFAGISGDMIVGALLDLGASLERIERELSKITLPKYEITAEPTTRRGFAATKFTVRTGKEEAARDWNEIRELIENSGLNEDLQVEIVSVFRRLAQAEAKVHGSTLETVHFHEVGAVDAIIDVAASMVAMKELCITSVASSPVATGTGLVETAHGQMPLPAPAVAELLTGVPIYSTTLQNELATPTGAAILVSCATSFGELPLFQLAGIGYGAGSRELPIPNVLRVFLGTTVQRQEEIMVIESTLDTADGESLAYLMEKLLDAGALDAWFTPVYMKKGRPGVTLTALTLPGLETKAADVIFSEGLTLGVRIEKKLRVVARREIVDVQTSLGPVKVKVARYNQSIISIRPEFEDCRKIARDGNLPLAEARKRLTEEAAALLGFEQRPPADR